MLNWVMRYQPFIRLLEQNRVTSVIDVGSGWYGLSWYWPHQVVQTDLSFVGTTPTEARPGRPAFVASSAESLPFADDSFDYAISSDMIEHLPAHLRSPAVRELARVARRGVLVGFPSGAVAQTADRRVAHFLDLLRRPRPTWLEEHLAQEEYPDSQTVADALPEGWSVTHEEPNGNGLMATIIIGGEMLRPVAWLTRVLERHVARRGMPALASMGAPMRRLYLLQPNERTVSPRSTAHRYRRGSRGSERAYRPGRVGPSHRLSSH